MVRSYEVEFSLIDNSAGFMLYCFENDECVWEKFFADSSEAHAMGHKFLDGAYVKLMEVA